MQLLLVLVAMRQMGGTRLSTGQRLLLVVVLTVAEAQAVPVAQVQPLEAQSVVVTAVTAAPGLAGNGVLAAALVVTLGMAVKGGTVLTVVQRLVLAAAAAAGAFAEKVVAASACLVKVVMALLTVVDQAVAIKAQTKVEPLVVALERAAAALVAQFVSSGPATPVHSLPQT